MSAPTIGKYAWSQHPDHRVMVPALSTEISMPYRFSGSSQQQISHVSCGCSSGIQESGGSAIGSNCRLHPLLNQRYKRSSIFQDFPSTYTSFHCVGMGFHCSGLRKGPHNGKH